jgi:hypothetical protein
MTASLVLPSGPIPVLVPTSAAMTDADSAAYAGPPGSAHAPPRFYKLDFLTFDGTVDPLSWLNQCEQFFRDQRTLASDRTWLASYHLRGAAQTWYYAVERDEGMPTWERFRAVCQMQFGPPTQGTRLAELARLPFTSTVQEYVERYNRPPPKGQAVHGWLDRTYSGGCGDVTPPGSSDGNVLRMGVRAPRCRVSGAIHATTTQATTVSALQPLTTTTEAGRANGGHPRRVCPGAGHHAISVPAIIPGRAAGAPTQGPLLQL